MPLFFILSGITYRFCDSPGQLRSKASKSARHLLVPVLFIWLLGIFTDLVSGKAYGDAQAFLINKFLALCFSSGVAYDCLGIRFPAIGVVWFLTALFFGRTLYDAFQLFVKNRRLRVVISLCIGTFGMILGRHIRLPLVLDIALAIFPLFTFGECWKRRLSENFSFSRFSASFFIWASSLLGIVLLSRTYLEIASRRFPMLLLSFVPAIAGTVCFSEFAKLTLGTFLEKPLCILGQYSLYMVCIHSVDTMWSFIWDAENLFQCMFLRLLTDILIFILILYLRKIYIRIRERSQT